MPLWLCSGDQEQQHFLAVPCPPSEVGWRWGGGRCSHLASLGAVLLEEVVELVAGCPLAGAAAQALGGHFLNPGVGVQQVLGAAGMKGFISRAQWGTASMRGCVERQRPPGPGHSLALEVFGDTVQTHDQILFPGLQVKAAGGTDQEVPGLASSGLGVTGWSGDGEESQSSCGTLVTAGEEVP